MLPIDTPYIDAYEGMERDEAVEGVVIFEDIYPRRVGKVENVSTKEYNDTIENEDGTTTVTPWDAYRFEDSGIEFSRDYVLDELRVKFESGRLNGLEFAVTFDPDGSASQLWEIVRNEDYGRPLPDTILYPEDGDEYVLSGFNIALVSDQYVPLAEAELKEEAIKYVQKSTIDPTT